MQPSGYFLFRAELTMKRVNIFYCFSIFLIILFVNVSLATSSGQKEEALASDVSKVDEIQNSKVMGFPGGRGFPWGGYGRAFPWFGPGGNGPAGGPGGWYPFGGWFPWGGSGFHGGGGSGGGGEGGNHPGGTPGTPGGWFPWGGRGGDGGGSGGSPGSPGGPNCGGNGGGPGGGAGGCGGNGGAGGGAGGGRGGGWMPPHATMPNPSNAPCGNMQIIPSVNGYTISYDCGNCKYQYTVDSNGMTTGGSGNCS